MLIFWLVFRRIAGSDGQSILSFGRSRAGLLMDKDTGVSFADVAAADEAEFELEEVVEFLRGPKRYQELGAKIPKGVLLVGTPGTRKTVLARAVAGEARVPSFCSAEAILWKCSSALELPEYGTCLAKPKHVRPALCSLTSSTLSEDSAACALHRAITTNGSKR
jgi:ATPase family associated with various cellular activities (AAA)